MKVKIVKEKVEEKEISLVFRNANQLHITYSDLTKVIYRKLNRVWWDDEGRRCSWNKAAELDKLIWEFRDLKQPIKI